MGNKGDDTVRQARAWAASAPFYRTLAIEIDEIVAGRARLRMVVDERHLNADGIVHGGVLPALADAAMGSAARTLHGERAQLLTAESNLRYLGAVEGGCIVAEGRVMKAGRRLAVVEVDVRREDGELVARGGATFVIQMRE